MHFTATIIPGLGEAKKQGFPTLNFSLEDVPKTLEQGVFAVRIESATQRKSSLPRRMPMSPMPQDTFPGVMYYGPRFHHGNELVCEVHYLKKPETDSPPALEVHIEKKLRDPQKFYDDEALVRQIESDAAEAKKILLS